MSEACFTAADILLPAAGVPLDPWACIAVDQFTSQPEYWQRAEHLADGKPSTLHIVLPEAYLGTPQEAERLESIRRTMEEYRKSVLTRKVHGYVYVERTQMDGTVRQGLVGAVDLDAYDYAKGSKPAIRPSESTVVERIPPRLKVRRGATLETPHVMMLADDADCTLIEPIGLMKNQLPPLYDGELMLGGGHLRGWAVEDPALIAGIDAALAARNCRFYTTSYTGDGELTKTWTFPAKPILIVLTCPTQWLLAVINAREGHGWGQLGGNSVTGLPCTVDGNSATWSAENNSQSWMGNNKDTQYGMFAILEAE